MEAFIMRFKKRKPLHRPRQIATLAESQDWWRLLTARWKREYPAEGEFFFTAPLAAGLEQAARDESLPDMARLDCWLMRAAWGNWYPYAVENIQDMKHPPDMKPLFRQLLFGPGPCP